MSWQVALNKFKAQSVEQFVFELFLIELSMKVLTLLIFVSTILCHFSVGSPKVFSRELQRRVVFATPTAIRSQCCGIVLTRWGGRVLTQLAFAGSSRTFVLWDCASQRWTSSIACRRASHTIFVALEDLGGHDVSGPSSVLLFLEGISCDSRMVTEEATNSTNTRHKSKFSRHQEFLDA